MKRLAKLGSAALFLVLLVPHLFAEPVTQLKPTGYVNDFAHVLDADSSAKIYDLAKQIDEKAHAQIAVVTINTLDGRDVESYAVDLFKQWGIGYKGTDRGVLILYAIQDHRARIEVGYGLEPILPDGKVGGFQREAVPLMRENKYNDALLLVSGRVADVIAKDAGVQLTGYQAPPPRAMAPDEPPQKIPGWAIVVGIIVFFFLLSTSFGRWLLFFLLFQGGGRGGGGFGGFGGGGGGGGFGGFGGGSSGGGGASSSW